MILDLSTPNHLYKNINNKKAPMPISPLPGP